MGVCLQCCKCSAFFGIIFYILIGVIIFTQSQFLKFPIDSSGQSAGTCLIAAAIEAVILVGIICYERRQESDSVTRENYVPLENERRPRETTFKGIAMGDLKIMREEKEKANESIEA